MLPPKPSHMIQIKTLNENRFAEVEWATWQDLKDNQEEEGLALIKLRITPDRILTRALSGEGIGVTRLKKEKGIMNLIKDIQRDYCELYIECIRMDDQPYWDDEGAENERCLFNYKDGDYYQLKADYITHNEKTGEITIVIEDTTPTAGNTQLGDGQHLVDRIIAISNEREDMEIPN